MDTRVREGAEGRERGKVGWAVAGPGACWAGWTG